MRTKNKYDAHRIEVVLTFDLIAAQDLNLQLKLLIVTTAPHVSYSKPAIAFRQLMLKP